MYRNYVILIHLAAICHLNRTLRRAALRARRDYTPGPLLSFPHTHIHTETYPHTHREREFSTQKKQGLSACNTCFSTVLSFVSTLLLFQYKSFRFKGPGQSTLPFSISDQMGVEEKMPQRMTSILKHILKGKIQQESQVSQ